jgi:hypothetical protein
MLACERQNLRKTNFSRSIVKTTFRENGEHDFRFRCCSYLLMGGLVLSQVEALLSVPTVVRELTTFLRTKIVSFTL